MTRETYVYIEGMGVIPKSDAPRKDGSIYVISDNLEDVRNPVDGKLYTSKAKYYRTVHQSGYEIVGNDTAAMYASEKNRPKLPTSRPDIQRALYQLRNR